MTSFLMLYSIFLFLFLLKMCITSIFLLLFILQLLSLITGYGTRQKVKVIIIQIRKTLPHSRSDNIQMEQVAAKRRSEIEIKVSYDKMFGKNLALKADTSFVVSGRIPFLVFHFLISISLSSFKNNIKHCKSQ